MHSRHASRLYLLLAALLTMLAVLAGCTAATAPAAATLPAATLPPVQPTEQPTSAPVQSPEPTSAPTELSGPIEDPQVFKAALLQALMDKDTQKLEGWMSRDFLTGGWRADGSYSSPADGLRTLYDNYLGADNRLELVEGADLVALMGGYDPLTMSREDAGVIEAALVSGFGKDGRDEAIMLISREPDNSLKWHGWVIIQGGFSGARIGGIQPYSNETYGYSLFLPESYEILETNPDRVLVVAPGEGHPGEGRAAAFIDVEPANGLSVQEITDKVKAELGPGFEIPPGTAMGLDKAMAIVLSGIPGQDANRQLFVVYNDLLYHITFVPDSPQVGEQYRLMEDLYAMIVNTFHFTD